MKSTVIIWIFQLSTSFVRTKEIVEFVVLEPESDSAEMQWLMSYDLWGLKLNLNFSSSSLRIMSSSARYERYKGNQVLFWWVHSTCWSSSAEMWANPVLACCYMSFAFQSLSVIGWKLWQRWLWQQCSVGVWEVPMSFQLCSQGQQGVCVCQWHQVTRQALSPLQSGGTQLSRWHCIPRAGTACSEQPVLDRAGAQTPSLYTAQIGILAYIL